MRRRLLVAGIALIGALTALGCASDSSAYIGTTIVELTATGPSPQIARMTAGMTMLEFVDHDSVPHRVSFANGRCSLDIAPGEPTVIGAGVNVCPFEDAGSYAYSEDGRFAGTVDIAAAPRTVTLTARRHVVRRGKPVTLRGYLTYVSAWGEPVPRPGAPFPVIVLARHSRSQPFRRIAMLVVRAGNDGLFPWHLRVRPGIRTTYIAEATGQARIWKRATSSPFTIRVRRQPTR